MSKEEGLCKWHFDPQTGEEEGPGDALGQNFKGEPYAALVRESIQNSLDVPIREGTPVKVSYSFGFLSSDEFENLFKIKDHIRGCKDYWKSKPDIVKKYDAKLKLLDGDFAKWMPYIKISDSNTQGMAYYPNDNNCPFYAFVRASKISVKGGSYQGGTYGFGKAAYFQVSPINTLIVSTMTEDGRVFFEGKSSLCTHLHNGQKKTTVGYYDTNEGTGPIDKIEDIPLSFRRSEPGTDFYILGFKPTNMDKAIEIMMAEVLRSFHPAILEGMLEVEIKANAIDVITINSNTIEGQIGSFFPDEDDTSGQFRTLNPRPYYDALIHKGEGRGYLAIHGHKEHLGDVTLYVKKVKGATDKIVYMRRPRMIVYSQKTGSSIGFYGVFICDDPNGDPLLSLLENSSHSKWDPSFYRDDITNDYIEEGVIAMKELKEFRDECIKELAGDSPTDELTIPGLEDLLYIPDKLIDEDDEEQPQTLLGRPTGNIGPENGALTTTAQKFKEDELNLKSPRGTIVVEGKGKPKNIDEGKDIIMGGHTGGHGGGGRNIGPGGEKHTADIEDDNGKQYYPMNVPIRVFAQEELGTVYHIVLIHSNRVVDNGKMELMVCGEQFDMPIDIAETDNGKANKNTILQMSFGKEVVRVKIRFADNMPHTVQTKLYYEE